MNKIIFSFIIVAFLFSASANAARKSMWVWDTHAIVGILVEENRLINECINAGITDVYLYTPNYYLASSSNYPAYQSFISRMNCKTIRVWGMDGWRGYFSDLCGPSDFYDGIQKVIDYNTASSPEQRFAGFHGDNEFHATETSSGCGPGTAFHYGSKDVTLSTTAGSGVWQNTAKKDRDSLMTDFVRQTHIASTMCHNAGIEYSIAVMAWIPAVSYSHNAIGQQTTPLYALYKGTNKPLYQHLMDYLDEYVVMSYHTNVSGKIVPMCNDVLAYADGITVRPRIFSAVETGCGVGQYVSYCDTPGEDSKSHVLSEMSDHLTLLGTHAAYSGIALHDWVGWRNLSVASSNISTPDYSNCVSPVTSVKKEAGISATLYPNPGENKLFIELKNNLQEKISINVLDGQGKLLKVMTVNSENNIELNTESLLPGIYFIQFSDQTVKWIKQ